jgi:hypothetical protein
MLDIYEACACVDEFLEASTEEPVEEKKDLPAAIKDRVDEAKARVTEIHEKIKKKASDDHDVKVFVKANEEIIKQCKDSISYNNATIKIIEKNSSPAVFKKPAIKSIEVQNKILEAQIEKLEEKNKLAKAKEKKDQKKEDKVATEAYVDALIDIWNS